MPYEIVPACSDDEDLDLIKVIGHCLYNYPLDELAHIRSRDELARHPYYLGIARRPGKSAVIKLDGKIVGGARVTPDPEGSIDPVTGTLDHWDTVGILPDHRGNGLSRSVRLMALALSPAKSIRSRVDSDNPRSWKVAEQLGFQLESVDGKTRYYRMRRGIPAVSRALRDAVDMEKVAAILSHR